MATWQDRPTSVAAVLDMTMSQPNNAFRVQVWINKPREASPWNG